ncbi:MAG: serine hydrolase [Peptostreptococcus sp.]|uniref:D-alanyl-D-alanine carboxypeptidase family protein n=1 Tax=Peptostreptococcus sp. TaxID=1262 RepID=UPI002FCC9040
MKKKSLLKGIIVLLTLTIVIFNLFSKGVKSDTYLDDEVSKSNTELKKDLERLDIESKYLTLYDKTNNKIVYSISGDKKAYPASLTKLMTVMAGIDEVKDVNEEVKVPIEAYDKLYQEGASMAGFSPGERVSYKDLLYGAILPSGGEAAMSISYLVSGSEQGFVDIMNRKSDELGLKNTHFKNSTGLHSEDNYSTTNDMSFLISHALDNSLFREIYSSKRYSMKESNKHSEGMTFRSTLFEKTDSNLILGGKTGYTTQAGNCLSTYSKINGVEYILVTMNANGKSSRDKIAVRDAENIYQVVYNNSK